MSPLEHATMQHAVATDAHRQATEPPAPGPRPLIGPFRSCVTHAVKSGLAGCPPLGTWPASEGQTLVVQHRRCNIFLYFCNAVLRWRFRGGWEGIFSVPQSGGLLTGGYCCQSGTDFERLLESSSIITLSASFSWTLYREFQTARSHRWAVSGAHVRAVVPWRVVGQSNVGVVLSRVPLDLQAAMAARSGRCAASVSQRKNRVAIASPRQYSCVSYINVSGSRTRPAEYCGEIA
ncbi:hypothetical protein B0T24DRAFT_305286 [Lasiosphaeria ovina]|uniref:Uncharacterized protein n=1 Tax=Lasiosphaeria ovina TaxID=92902 RepID=A0AAE0N560_9PEZI|nr:hypothetical protein B0T24DRAFT_305286 [Lasiosphaeria ovina]